MKSVPTDRKRMVFILTRIREKRSHRHKKNGAFIDVNGISILTDKQTKSGVNINKAM
jgi:hypothetical protein